LANLVIERYLDRVYLAIRGIDLVLLRRAVNDPEIEKNERPHDKNGERDRLRIPGDLVPLEFYDVIIA
jgi:hypothetical protein